MVWTCLPYFRFGQNHLARHRERGKKTRQTEKKKKKRGGKATSGNGQAWSSPSPEGRGEQIKIEETGSEIMRLASTTLALKG